MEQWLPSASEQEDRLDIVSPSELPRKGLSDDVVDVIAKEIGKAVASHIETMYPEAAAAVAWKSAALSIEGVVRNAVCAAGKAAEAGKIKEWLTHSKSMRQLDAKIRQNSRSSESNE